MLPDMCLGSVRFWTVTTSSLASHICLMAKKILAGTLMRFALVWSLLCTW